LKTLYIISGADGSGKTTFAKSFSSINELYFINADEIFEEIANNDEICDSEKYDEFKKDIDEIYR